MAIAKITQFNYSTHLPSGEAVNLSFAFVADLTQDRDDRAEETLTVYGQLLSNESRCTSCGKPPVDCQCFNEEGK